jgi:glycyl-tRNA synthetase beta chain
VVRPRLADAKFFFDQDRKKTLASRVDGLAKVVYHGKLGTQGERTERVAAIARYIGSALGADAEQAARLAKADLLTDMVGEFPELQGIMGRYYALADGLPAEVAEAIEDHYKPRFAGDDLPRSNTGLAVALADKLETLAGLFGVGQLPTGDKDPFALRRHALGVVRMLVERQLPLDIDALVAKAVETFGPLVADPGKTTGLVVDFMFDRLAVSLRDQGFAAQEIDAVLSRRGSRVHEVPRALAAVKAFAALPEAASLAAANKRVGNILNKSEGAVGTTTDPARFVEPQEQALFEALRAADAPSLAAFEKGDYTASLQALAVLKAPVDAFFDAVMVNAEDPALRANRLALLASLHAAMNRVADLSKLAT